MLKNITLSAEEKLIHKAREKARKEHTTLNAQFRQWLENYTHLNASANEYEALMDVLSYAKPARHYTRDELNER